MIGLTIPDVDMILLVTGGLVAVGSTIAGAILQEQIESDRADLESELSQLRRIWELRNLQVDRATDERHTAYLLLAITQRTQEGQAHASDDHLMPTLNVAGTRMAQAVLWLVGALLWSEDDPAAVLVYLAKKGVNSHIEAARNGSAESIGQLNYAYERIYEEWATASNRVNLQTKDLVNKVRQLETKLMRVKYLTASLQVTGILIAVFNNIA